MKVIVECAYGNIMPKGANPTEGAEKFGCNACEYIFENKIKRCHKFVYLAGQDPQHEDQRFIDEGKCSDTWGPILQIEMANTNRGQTAALESFRNETVKGQNEFNSIVKNNLSLEVIK